MSEPPDDDHDALFVQSMMDALVARRKALGMTQEQVGQHMGTMITQSRVAKIERGNTDPRLSTVQRYARAVGAQVTLVLDEEEATGEPPARVVLSAEAFDRLAAELDEPPRPIPALIELLQRPRRVQLQQDD
jgi:transcriptional regulator with XRE-family HTH domain